MYAVPSHAQTATPAAAAKATRTAATRAAAPNATPIDVTINKSEHIVMLSQRAAKLYVQSALGIAPGRAGYAGAKAKFDIARKEFLAVHKALAESKEATADIKRKLALTMNSANMLFTNFVDEKVGGAQNAALVGKSTEVMMQMQQVVTTMFEKL